MITIPTTALYIGIAFLSIVVFMCGVALGYNLRDVDKDIMA